MCCRWRLVGFCSLVGSGSTLPSPKPQPARPWARHVPQLRRAGGASRLPARRGMAPQLRLRRCDRCLSRGAEDRSVVRDGVLGRGDELQPAALVLRGSPQGRAALARLAPTPAAASRRRRRRASRGSCAPSRRCSGPATRPRARPRTPGRWRSWRLSIPADERRRRSTRSRCWRPCRAATRRCRSGSRPARLPRGCSRATRNIPAPRITSFTPTITAPWRAKALAAARAYAKIAPAASHALHMPAHTFLQLGFWDEAAASRRSVMERVDRLGEAARPADHEPRLSTAWRGCSTSGRSRDGFRRRRKRSRSWIRR